MNLGVYRLRTDTGAVTVLAAPIRAGKAKAVFMDGLVKCRTLQPVEIRRLQGVAYRGKPYPVKRAVRQFRKAGKALGMTKAAKALIERVGAV